MPRKRFIGAALALCAAGSTLLASSAYAELDEVNSKKLRNAVTINGVMKHERALQAIANANDGTRASGTPGYDASAAYVEGAPGAARATRSSSRSSRSRSSASSRSRR